MLESPASPACSGTRAAKAFEHTLRFDTSDFPQLGHRASSIRRHYRAGGGVDRPALDPLHHAARLRDQQNAGREIPGVQPGLPEAVQDAVGDVGQVDRRGARSPHAGSLPKRLVQLPQVGVHHIVRLEGEAGAEQEGADVGGAAHADRLAVLESSASARGGPYPAERLGVHRGGEGAFRVPHRHRSRVVGMAVHVVGRAVQGVDQPDVTRVRGAGVLAAFLFGHDRVVRVPRPDHLEGGLLGGHVHVGDEVAVRGLLVDPALAAASDGLRVDLRGRARGFGGRGEELVDCVRMVATGRLAGRCGRGGTSSSGVCGHRGNPLWGVPAAGSPPFITCPRVELNCGLR